MSAPHDQPAIDPAQIALDLSNRLTPRGQAPSRNLSRPPSRKMSSRWTLSICIPGVVTRCGRRRRRPLARQERDFRLASNG